MREKLYRTNLTNFCRDGEFSVVFDIADAVVIDGVLYASMYRGAYMTRADGEWHRTEAAAKLAAAEAIEKRLAGITAQVARLREEAMEPVTA